MSKSKKSRIPENLLVLVEFLKVLLFVYLFLVSIDLMGMSFKASGSGFKSFLNHATANPFVALVIGIVVTSIIQSSSTTTSTVVAMVAAGTISLQNAIPIIMGANIGTTVTNTIVSFGYLGRRTEFERSFGASIVHDMFNVFAVLILFPIELYTHVIFKTSVFLEKIFEGLGGFNFVSPLKYVVRPAAELIEMILSNHYLMLVAAFALLFFSMKNIIENMKGIVMEKIERVLNRYLFRNAFISLVFGIIFTAIVQSSSITTSIIIPLVGAGVLTIEQIFPYTLGANIGTTITALLAALTLSVPAAMTVAISHLTFNVFGIVLIYPIKIVPISIVKVIAAFVSKSKRHFLMFLVIYIVLHLVPILLATF